MNKTKIGLEIHLRIKTNTKLFSNSRNDFNLKPNIFISHYDLAYPGSLPQLNEETVNLGLTMGYLLNCQLDNEIHFDRKNYFYFDSPKGFQITQYFRPLATKGYLNIFLPNNRTKKIIINSVIIEEDTAKSIYKDDLILIDYNRCGVPLLEIVTEPVFENFTEVKLFLQKLIRLSRRANISEADFSKGYMRVDVNISNTLDGKNFCSLTEIKNLNSLNNIKKAINLETKIQIENFHKMQKSQTKNYDENLQKLVFLREKFSKHDYFFIQENNILPIIISESKINQIKEKNKNLNDFENQLQMKYQLPYEEFSWLIENENLSIYFERIYSYTNDLKIIFLILKQIFVKWNTAVENLFEKMNWNLFAQLLKLLKDEKINFKVFEKYLKEYGFESKNILKEIEKDIQSQNNNLTSDEDLISLLKEIISQDKDLLNKYRNKPNATSNYLIGKIMKLKGKKVSPKKASEVIKMFFDNLTK